MNRIQWLVLLGILAIAAGVLVLLMGPAAPKNETPQPIPADNAAPTDNTEIASEPGVPEPIEQPIETANPAPALSPSLGTGHIHGTLRMADGSPVPTDITVTLLTYEDAADTNDPVTREIDRAANYADNAFDFPELAFGSYIIHAGNANYTQHASCTLTADRFEFETNLTLYPGGSISGRVMDGEGQPIPNARIFVAAYHIGGSVGEADRDRAIGSQVATAEDGQFAMPHLRRSTDNDSGYKLAVTAEGYALFTSEYIHAGTDGVELVLTSGGTAQGQLIRYDSREPLPGKSLHISSGIAVGDRIVETGPDGWFFAPALAAGDHKVELMDDELALMPETEQVTITPGREASDLLLLAATGGIVTGHVRDSESGRGIPNAEVQLSGQRARTDARGAYRFAGLKGGDYHVSVGEVIGYARFSDRNSPNRRITVSPGVEFDNVDFQLYRGLRVSGVVVDESGSPVPHADVTASTFGSNNQVNDSADADAQGRFSLVGFPPNSSVMIQAYKDELFAARENHRFDIENADLNGITIKMMVSTWVSGHVVDQSGIAVARMRLVARPPGQFEQSSSTRTRTDGSFVISRLLPGTYEIHLQNNGPISADALHTFTIAKGQKIEGLRLIYEAGDLTISGTVTDSNNQPIHPAAVVELSNIQRRALTDAEGHFTLTGLDDREYTLFAIDQENSTSDTQSVRPGANNIRFVIKEKAAIEGNVIDAGNGQAVTNFEIDDASDTNHRNSYDASRFQAVSHPEGRFTLQQVSLGSRTVLVKADGYALASVTVPDLQPGEIRSNILVRLEPEAHIEGRVADERGNPIGDARIYLGELPRNWQRDNRHRTTTDATGAFKLTEMNAGSHEIWAVHDYFIPASTQVTAAVGYPANALITLNSGGTIAGRITVAGRPVQAGRINANQRDNARGGTYNTRTNANGYYEIAGLPEGEYSTTAYAGPRSRKITAQVAKNMTTEVNVDFPNATGRIYGRVTGSNDQPLPGDKYFSAVITNADGLSENQRSAIASDGKYEFAAVPPGAVAITLRYNNKSHRSEFQIRDGQSVQHNIVVDEGSTIEVSVSGVDNDADEVSVAAITGEVDLDALAQNFLIEFTAMQSSSDIVHLGAPHPNQMVESSRIRNGRATLTGLEPGDYTILVLRVDAALEGDIEAQLATLQFLSKYIIVEKNVIVPLRFNF